MYTIKSEKLVMKTPILSIKCFVPVIYLKDEEEYANCISMKKRTF